MKVHEFKLNESGSSRLVVTVINVPPMMQKTPALIHVPGGGFMACSESDGVNLAARLTARGFGVTCTYLYPVGRDYRFPQVTVDLMRCIKILRDHAAEWGVDPKKIVISGNSAGAFICMTAGNLWNREDLMAAAGCTGDEGRPDAMILGFGPMYCGQQDDDGITYVPNGDLVGEQTSPAFFHHARLDTLVSVYQTIAMIDAMEKNGRPYGVYISSNGGHGETGGTARLKAADGTVGPCLDDWFEGCWNFLANTLDLPQTPQSMPAFMGGGPGGPGAGGPGGPGMPPPSGEGAPAMPPMMFNMPVPPEGSEPNGPGDMPFGRADNIHMPFNVAYKDKDFKTYK